VSSWAVSTAAEAIGAQLCETQIRTSVPIKYSSDSRKGHERVESANAYIHADPTLKERALDRLTPLNPAAKPGRYKPADELLAFLTGL
jgi:hypothetical protein